jgi:DNA repair protein RadC
MQRAFQDSFPFPSPLDSDEADPVALPGRLPSYIKDHRKRLRDRFTTGGAAAMPDYELLELILFQAIPRQDVKPLAHRLIARFGDLAGVLTARDDRLLDIDGIGPAVICELRIIAAAAERMAQRNMLKREVISSWDAVVAYCRTAMAHQSVEQFRILFLDRKNVLIADEAQARGTVDHVPVYPREVVKRALDLDASALILVHNHPSGDPTPSQSDIAMTEQIVAAAAVFGITIHDHLIIGRSREVSFRATGLL